MMQLKIGSKGEIVIPKKIREYLGLSKDRRVIITVKDKSLEIKPAPTISVAEEWEKRAKRLNVNVDDWIMGDKLYEEVF